jgi:hypothetical protein
MIYGIVPFRWDIAKRACPVAERHAAVHAAAGLKHAVAGVQGLLYLAEIVNPVMYRPVACLFARH